MEVKFDKVWGGSPMSNLVKGSWFGRKLRLHSRTDLKIATRAVIYDRN